MIADNDYISEQFSLLAKLMDIHGENSFKTKSYSVAAFTIEKLPQPLQEMPPEKFTSIKGIGDAIGKKIEEIINTGELSLLRKYIEDTPAGVIEMLQLKGLGPKKIATIWKEMDIESIGELLYACQENRLLLYKGFGEKTQNNVRDTIEFYLNSQGSRLYADVDTYATTIQSKLQKAFPSDRIAICGEFSRQLDIIDQLQWVTTATPDAIRHFFLAEGFTEITSDTGSNFVESLAASSASASSSPSAPSSSSPGVRTHFNGAEAIPLEIIHTSPDAFESTVFESSASAEFLHAWQQRPNWDRTKSYATQEEIFSAASIHFIPPFRREQPAILEEAAKNSLPAYIQSGDIKGIIHSHSDWSDGSNTLEQMARACIAQGFEYLVISDHSKSAFYANGLKEDRVAAQHQLVDELNRQLAPFVIFKSIESDILNDGSLDYADNILSTFDLVIASVHSNLKMTEEKAMARVIKAIENPYTTILGHPTGRLLLSRPGYPLDHKKIIDACAANKVVIELNAHPRRLDMDWRWIDYARQKEVLISIDPDAHSIAGYDVIKYGTLAAQKGGLTKEGNLSSFGLAQFSAYLASRRKT